MKWGSGRGPVLWAGNTHVDEAWVNCESEDAFRFVPFRYCVRPNTIPPARLRFSV